MITMKILVVGSGGREHAIAQALANSKEVIVYAAMSRENPGIARLSKEVLITKETDLQKIATFCRINEIKYAFIGPEIPLEAGIVDTLEKEGVQCVGPTRAAARIETDKGFCRDLMRRYNIPGLPEYYIFRDPTEAIKFIQNSDMDYAIKPTGLTGGKGVKIMGEHVDREGACSYIREVQGDIIIEERFLGEEFTLQAFVDGSHIIPMPLVQDHKRAFEGDTGPNTGGMGSYTLPDHRLPFVTEDEYTRALSIMKMVVSSLFKEGTPYVGILYGQFMNTVKGPMVIEFNARFGDPEAMNVLSLIKSDLGEIVRGITSGNLDEVSVIFENKASVCKYIVPDGYPDHPQTNKPFTIHTKNSAILYYASVLADGDSFLTLSSRTIAFVGIGDTLEEAEAIAEEAAEAVKGPIRYRRDIGTRKVLEKRIQHMQEIR